MRIGLVLGGGGANGAYQVGVYKALCEAGIDPSAFYCIAGTSVGALNALLFAVKNADDAEKMWHEMRTILPLSKSLFGALIYNLIVYGTMGLPILLSVASLGGYAIARLSAHFRPPGVFQPRAVHFLFLAAMLAIEGLVLIGYHARTSHFTGRVLAYTFNPQILFNIGVPIFLVLVYLDAILKEIELRPLLLAAGGGVIFWSFAAFVIYRAAAGARRFSFLRNDELQRRVEEMVPHLQRHAAPALFATVARERAFAHPWYETEYESEWIKERAHRQDDPGKFMTKWVPEYVEVRKRSLEDQVSTFLTTSAIPLALPIRKDPKGWLCDGGIVDNLPMAAATNLAECDALIVVPLNSDDVPTAQTIQAVIDRKWADATIPNLSAHQKLELIESVKANGGNWLLGTPGRRTISFENIIVIAPSQPLSTIDFWGLRFLTGTMCFSDRAISKWIKLGHQDAEQALKARTLPKSDRTAPSE